MKKILGYFSSIFGTLQQIKLERNLIRVPPERSEVDMILLECELTNHLQEQVDLCNRHFKNFQLRLKMEEPPDNQSESVVV